MKPLYQYLNESMNRDASVANLKNFGFEPDAKGLICTKDGHEYDIYISGMPENGKCIMIPFTTLSVLSTNKRRRGIVFMDENTAHQDEVYAIDDIITIKDWVFDNLGNVKFMWNSTLQEVKRYGFGPGLDYITIEVSALAKQDFCKVIKK